MRNINEGYPSRQSAKLEKKISHREYQERKELHQRGCKADRGVSFDNPESEGGHV